jgi:hypothetical protein
LPKKKKKTLDHSWVSSKVSTGSGLEPSVEVEDRVEESCSNGCELFIGGKGDHHHPIVSESNDQTEDTIEIPQKLGCTPFKEQHGICDERINERFGQKHKVFQSQPVLVQKGFREQHQ